MLDILLVDDSAAIRKILQRVLRQTDLPIGEVFEAADGQDAIDQLKTHPVGLVLSDINMPRMDGLQMLAAAREMESMKKVPIVMITTEGGHAKVMEALQLGASGYVKKPFNAEQIKEKLASLLVA